MRRGLIVLLLSGVLAALVVGAWLASGGSGAVGLGGADPMPHASTRAGPAEPLRESAASSTVDVERSPVSKAQGKAKRPRYGAKRLRPQAKAAAIEGRVVIPAGTPADERVQIVLLPSRARAWEATNVTSTDMAADGSFRFEPGPRPRFLGLRARYLFLESDLRLKKSRLAGPILLEPSLGARILVDVEAPSGPEGALPEGTPIRIRVTPRSKPRAPVRSADRVGDRRFEVSGVPPNQELVLELDSPALLDESRTLPPLAPGQTFEVVLSPRPGIRLEGLVLDEAGGPIEGAQLRIRYASTGRDLPQPRERSRAAGSFALAGIPDGEWILSARHPAFLSADLALGEATDGDCLEGLRLVMATGGVIAGSVTRSDGTPVRGATIRVVLAEPDAWSVEREKAQGETDDDGRYRITGLAPGRYGVRASFDRGGGPSSKEKRIPRGLRALEIGSWIETREDVRVPGPDVDFVAASEHELRGKVVDDRGLPVSTFYIALHAPGGGVAGRGRFASESGEFRLTGIAPGEWRLNVKLSGHVAANDRVRVPEPAEVTVTLVRRPRVTGTVVDAAGHPVSGAWVSAWPAADSDSDFSEVNGAESSSNKSGTFDLGLYPGAWHLTARTEDRVQLQPTFLHLEAGQIVEGLLLQLAPSGEIRVSLHPDMPGPGIIHLSLVGDDCGEVDLPRNQLVDLGSGREHVIADLIPGEYTLIAQCSSPSGRWSDDPVTIGSFEKAVRLEAGESLGVVVGEPPKELVRVHGRVRRSGRPVAQHEICWRNIDSRWRSFATTDGEGCYELEIERGTRFEVDWGASNGARQRVDVPEHAMEFTHELDLPSGSISGRVSSGAGELRPHVAVRVLRTGSGSPGTAFEAPITEDGTFTIEELEAGTYELVVTDRGRRAFGRPGTAGATACSSIGRLRGVSVAEGEAVRGVEIVLVEPATILARVRDTARSAGIRARVEVTYANGNEAVPWAITDRYGRTTIQGLSPDEYLLRASTETSASDWTPCSLREGETIEIELVLR